MTLQMFSVDSVDLTETRMFILASVQAVLTAILFGLIFFLVAATRIATLDPAPESAILSILLGAVPAVVFGAGFPYLVQRREYFNRLNDSFPARLVGTLLMLGTYVGLFFYHPATSLIYAVVYLLSRVTILVGIYGGSRIKAILA
ncbi:MULTISPECIES: hypothetical protein [unclassified Haloferax]|uniref:hypothetical protein n=1 Tax=unclassified Haloferax TaxID=2625095 RepID=UPI0028740E55|nr:MULTISPECIES: hypothetical protein [unclassified Haloferax]MDS0243752.1 hypothetical protein [Haloferax sp. S2CR25]MDS0446873.1 hypothetical protein [Haloferax sp. S2CR25-2]